MLRIAVPNKGSLAQEAAEMLRKAGYRQRRDDRELVLVDHDNNCEFFYLRPRDVATYVGAGTVDVGITGRDLLLDSKTTAVEQLPLGFAGSTFRVAAPIGAIASLSELAGKRIATSYPRLLRHYLSAHDITPAAIVQLDGAVESAVRLGIADAIADVVDTGSTLKAAGLEIIGDPILVSEAVLITAPSTAHASDNLTFEAGVDSVVEQGTECPTVETTIAKGIARLASRLTGVITAREWVLMDYVVPQQHLEAAVAITPGLESPTISPLHEEGWVAVRVMAKRATMNKTMDELHDVGAKGTVVSAILAARF